ncbi:MAG: DNA repair protein RecN [Lachnospiraceae bacterium]|nr:DNA repair protein RecN [Lachnospiraceae bacterium]
MLRSLRVNNFALIEELEITFDDGLNILTGETGAGKSILLGSIQTALGAKTSKDVIRNGAEAAYVEIVFENCGQAVEEELKRQDLSTEDGSITISRKVTSAGKSISRINGESVNAATVKAIASLLLEIHGQQEHHTLLNKEKHLELLDRYAGEELNRQKENVATLWEDYRKLKAELLQAKEDATNKNRDCSYLEFASREIAEAAYKPGELEALEQEFERLSHIKALTGGVAGALSATADGTGETADDFIQTAIRSLSKVSVYDTEVERMLEQAEEIASLLSDFNHTAAQYLESLNDSEEEYCKVSERLDLLNRLKSKYGKTMEEVLAYGQECEEKLARYADYDAYLERLENEYTAVEHKLETASTVLSEMRKKAAAELTKQIKEALSELCFLEVRFEIRFERADYSENGFDIAEFYIATNPGEAVKPLIRVASGGELSRIMLALKSVFADRDEIPTLIFDEIDTGISGRTAQMVSEKMATISGNRQLFCITHLPQIASMADTHFLIEKSTDGVKTVTKIERLEPEGSVKELARMLGGASITDAVLENAREMKELAAKKKKMEKVNKKN